MKKNVHNTIQKQQHVRFVAVILRLFIEAEPPCLTLLVRQHSAVTQESFLNGVAVQLMPA